MRGKSLVRCVGGRSSTRTCKSGFLRNLGVCLGHSPRLNVLHPVGIGVPSLLQGIQEFQSGLMRAFPDSKQTGPPNRTLLTLVLGESSPVGHRCERHRASGQEPTQTADTSIIAFGIRVISWESSSPASAPSRAVKTAKRGRFEYKGGRSRARCLIWLASSVSDFIEAVANLLINQLITGQDDPYRN